MRSAEHAPVTHEKYYKLKNLKNLAFAFVYNTHVCMCTTVLVCCIQHIRDLSLLSLLTPPRPSYRQSASEG
jgi:hypothetical protein